MKRKRLAMYFKIDSKMLHVDDNIIAMHLCILLIRSSTGLVVLLVQSLILLLIKNY